MAKARKDHRGRALRKGEIQRKDKTYMYTYTDPYGKRRYIYANDLVELREKEKRLMKDQLDGLDVYAAGNADLNFVFDRYITTKTELRRTTYTNYTYMYDRFVRDEFGKRKIGTIKYSDVLYFYYHLINDKGLQINTLETIHTVLHPTFQLAVRDDIIRNNPSDGVMAQIKKKPGKNHGVRHALTLEQQRAFMDYTAKSPVFCHWTPFFTVLLGTGCRIGEAIGLRWEDIDLEKRVISINHSVTYYPRRNDTTKCEFGANMPDISLLVNIAEIFNVSIPEIINGERKSEIMEKEAKKVAEAMSDYATAEKAVLLKRVKVISIIGLVALIIGLIMESICYDSMIPIYESIKGICLGLGVGALVTMVLYTTGILEKIKNKKSKQIKIVAGIGCAIMIICILVSLIVSII